MVKILRTVANLSLALFVVSGCSNGSLSSAANALPTSLRTSPHRIHYLDVAPNPTAIRFENAWRSQIQLGTFTLGTCPWVEEYNSYGGVMVADSWWPSPPGGPPDGFGYAASCSPWNEPATWAVSYATDSNDVQTSCTFKAQVTAIAQIQFSVANGADTMCSVEYDPSDGSGVEHLIYNQVAQGSPRTRRAPVK
jgi:hypothetical protein